MDSALRPRDIQARIRAGESLEDVARAAGVPAERVEVFAAPVIAEREHVAGLAQTHPVRRRGETTAHRTLRNAVADSLAQRGIEADAVRWDAWKLEDRRWQVVAAYPSGSRHHEALFVFDQTGRFSTAANDDARWLIGEESASHGPQPGRRPAVRPGAPRPVDDELAIVRALQTPASPVPSPASPASPDAASPASAPDAEDAYREGELTEVDGVYDIVPAETSELDVLYDMLSSFDEDSVKIYSGLVHPVPKDTGVVIDAPLGGDPGPAPIAEVGGEADPVNIESDAPEPAGDAPDPAADPGEIETARDGDVPDIEGDLTAAENTIVVGRVPRVPRPAAAASADEQEALIDDGSPGPGPKKPARRRRASVPSWDEIMFGSPHREP